MDIVELEGKPIAKKGKFSGRKKVYRTFKDGTVKFKVVPFSEEFHEDNYDKALVPILKNGEIVYKEEKPEDIRNYVLDQLSKIEEI